VRWTIGKNQAGVTGYPVPATPEMMQLVRDEHDLIADMIKAQLAAEPTGTRSKDQQSAPPQALSVQLPYRAPHLPCVAAETAEAPSARLSRARGLLLRALSPSVAGLVVRPSESLPVFALPST
jgi:hypothetical protein